MKKVFTLATAAFLMTGFAFAHGHEGDKKKAGKECCKDGKTCSKDAKSCCKDEKSAAKTTAKTATKKA